LFLHISLLLFFFFPFFFSSEADTYISHVIGILLELCQLFRVDDRHLAL